MDLYCAGIIFQEVDTNLQILLHISGHIHSELIEMYKVTRILAFTKIFPFYATYLKQVDIKLQTADHVTVFR